VDSVLHNVGLVIQVLLTSLMFPGYCYLLRHQEYLLNIKLKQEIVYSLKYVYHTTGYSCVDTHSLRLISYQCGYNFWKSYCSNILLFFLIHYNLNHGTQTADMKFELQYLDK
jgi:hypothetical protein